jgi:hypothetical protein
MQKVKIIKKTAAKLPNLLTPESFRKGEDFEKYTRNILFHPDHYTMIEKPHSYQDLVGDLPESILKPDYSFRDKITNTEFFVESKFRTYLFFDQLRWTYAKQLARYHEYNKLMPVFILLGLGNVAADPQRLFLLPLKNAKYKGLYLSEAKKFEIPRSEHVPSELLWKP